jgi:hypothetical protein
LERRDDRLMQLARGGEEVQPSGWFRGIGAALSSVEEGTMRAAYFLTRDPSVFRAPLSDRREIEAGEDSRFTRAREALHSVARLLTRRARPAPPLPAPER